MSNIENIKKLTTGQRLVSNLHILAVDIQGLQHDLVTDLDSLPLSTLADLHLKVQDLKVAIDNLSTIKRK